MRIWVSIGVLVTLWSLDALSRATPPAPFEIGAPVLGGSGCAAGGEWQIVREDNLIQFTFSMFNVQAQGADNPLGRKNCSISIPLTVNSGFSVAAPTVELSGLNTLAEGVTSSFDIEGFFAGEQGMRFKKEFVESSNYRFRNDATEIWSPCGEAVNMRVNMSVMVKSPTASSTTTVEKVTLLPLKWKRC